MSNIHNNHAPPPESFTLNGETIPNSENAKFLGVVIDNNLTFKAHIDHLVNRTRPLIYTLIDLKRSQVPKAALIKFYTTCIRPILLYACPGWFSMISQQQRERIRRIENIALKVTNPLAEDYDERVANAEIVPILSLLNTTSSSYIENINADTNHCLHTLATQHKPPRRERQSARVSTNTYSPKTRTELRAKSPFIFYHK